MSESTPKNIWEVTPNFSQMWKNNNNYGYTIAIEGIVASVSPYTTYVRKRVTDTHYVATITGFGLPHQLRNDSITSIDAGKARCEPWLRHFYKYTQQQKQVECYEGWLKYYQEELTKVQDQINAQKWEEIRQSFNSLTISEDGK